jgi:CSLREA domain-containing protein
MLAALAMAAGMLLAAARPANATTTFEVNTTADDDDGACVPLDPNNAAADCTLREAINAADNTAGADTINFEIPGTGVKTILVGSTPTGPTAGQNLPDITEAVTLNGYTQTGASKNTNTDLAQGTNANLLIELNGAYAGSSGNGLRINAPNVVVKGLVINRFSTGIFIFGTGSGAAIEGNFIGTDPSGTQNPGNASDGVVVFGGGANTIGGTSPAARNLISANLFRGLVIASNEGNTIQGNLIGTKANGINTLPNALEGIQIISSNNTVGGIDSDPTDTKNPANLIAFNGTDGITVLLSATGNRILSNSIFENGELGIDLSKTSDADGVTKNDARAKDRDTGGNNLQNFPVLSSAGIEGTTTTIQGTLKSTPRETFTIQFFSSAHPDPSGFGEGEAFLDQINVKTNRQGSRSFTFSPPTGAVAVGKQITATATRNTTGDTSEFSAAQEVTGS